MALVEAPQGSNLKMIQEMINRLANGSFQLKDWVVTLAGALQLFSKGAWSITDWNLRRKRLFRRFFDEEARGNQKAADLSMDTRPFRNAVGSVMQVAFSWALLLFYGPVLILLLESLLLHKAR